MPDKRAPVITLYMVQKLTVIPPSAPFFLCLNVKTKLVFCHVIKKLQIGPEDFLPNLKNFFPLFHLAIT